jgi:hypothetical protein
MDFGIVWLLCATALAVVVLPFGTGESFFLALKIACAGVLLALAIITRGKRPPA